MSENQPQRRIGRSIGALLAGMFVGILLTLGTDLALHAVGVFVNPNDKPERKESIFL